MNRNMSTLVIAGLLSSLAFTTSAETSQGLIGYWRLDEGSGSVAHDSIGGHDGTLHNFSSMANSGWTSGKLGGGVAFDGVDDYISTLFLPPTGNSSRTIACWAKTTSSTNRMVCAAYGGNVETPGSSFRAGFNIVCEGVTVNASWAGATYSAKISDDVWHHYAWVLPAGATTIGEVKVYMDGVRLTQTCWSANMNQTIDTTSQSVFEIGTYHNWEEPFFYNGALDEVRVYDGALSDGEVALLAVSDLVPIADAGPYQTAFVGEAVALDGSGSTDMDLAPLIFQWSFMSVPSGSHAVLSNPAAAGPTFVADMPGTYVVQLLVSDGQNHGDSDTVKILAVDPDKPVHFGDPALKDAVAKQLEVTDPTPNDMKRLYSLGAGGLGITCLTGLECATNLDTLSLDTNLLTDISALAHLAHLRLLNLFGNQIHDIAPLAELKNLTDLDLSGNEINDVSPLAELVNLKYLSIEYNQIADLSGLARLVKLETLYLGSNAIVDISSLRNLSVLRILVLNDNPIRDVSSIAWLTALNHFQASDCQIENISALAGLTNLESLHIGSNRITDINAVSGLKALKALGAYHNQITGISAVAGLSKLQELDLLNNRITDCSPVAGLTSLTYLRLSENQISGIAALGTLTNLTYLDLSYNRISNIGELSTLGKLNCLYLEGNQISDISPLSGLTSLLDLNLRWNRLNCDSYCTYIPIMKCRNLSLRCDPMPSSCDCPPYATRTYFVDDSATGNNDGSSWAHAFQDLQDALKAACRDEIRVAQGIYRPDQGTPVDRDATFQLKNGVTLNGGYAGVTGSDPNARDVHVFETILSGDLAKDDVGAPGDPSMKENSLHVVTADHTDSTARLEGFTIRGGMADDRAGGIQIYRGSPTIRSCTFEHNYTNGYGGGLWCLGTGGDVEEPISTSLIDCNFTDNYAEMAGGAIYTSSYIPVTLQNCRIKGNSAGIAGGGVATPGGVGRVGIGNGITGGGSNIKLTGCILADNHAGRSGAIEDVGSYRQYPDSVDTPGLILDDLTISDNGPDAGTIEDAYVLLNGDIDVTYGKLNIIFSLFEGPGTIHLSEETLLRFTGRWRTGYEPVTTVRTSIRGPGQIEIDAGQELIIEGNAVVNLGSSLGGRPDPNRDGRIVVKGSLAVQGNATIESTNIDVKLLDVNDPNVIQYNNIRLREASTGFGGEIFVGGNARITNNNIVSEGDRYLDLDPRPDDVNHPTIENNTITVIIKEGKLSRQGTLLELRARDYDVGTPANPTGRSGAYRVAATSAGFTKDPSANWVLEKLILEPNSKLNLTNRQGFEFQGFGEPYPETVYIKELVMGPNSVLNTGLQTLYYQQLVDPNGAPLVRDLLDPLAPLANGARFEDIPLLGFSLGIIAMNDQNEFDIRVRKRLTDSRDDPKQPKPDPNDPLKEVPPPLYIGSIDRIVADVPDSAGGVMEMRTQAKGKQSASSVAAKGAFARAGDEDITIEFEYLFREDPYGEAQLIVYLSDHPEVSKDYRKPYRVASIRPPTLGRPGSIGSGQFAVFSGTFAKRDLNFTRGTYVEMELQGRGACCWIDNWDPRITCGSTKCGDYDEDDRTNMRDYLMLVAEFGPSDPNRPDRRCLDILRDGCVGVDDLIVWDSGVLNACGIGSASTSRASSVSARSTVASPFGPLTDTSPATSSPLRIFGKSGDRTGYDPTLLSRVYHVRTEAVCIESEPNVGNGRLVTDGQGTVYQIDNDRGLVRRDNQQTVVRQQYVFHKPSGSTVYIGGEGSPLLDAVFSRDSSKTVYVVPVQVVGPDSNAPYLVAAKLSLNGSTDGYTVDALYGLDPARDPEQKNAPSSRQGTTAFSYEPDMQHLHEIEVDTKGRIYVLSSLVRETPNALIKDNYILVYDAAAPERSPVIVDLNDLDLVDPTAMVVSSKGDALYLACTASKGNDPTGLTAKVYRFSIETDRDGKVSVALKDALNLKGPEPDTMDASYANLCKQGQFVCMITSMTEDPSTGTLYATGFTAPRFTPDGVWEERSVGFFTTPMLAAIPRGAEGTISAASIYDSSSDYPRLLPLLPLSMVWTGGKGVGLVQVIEKARTEGR